jgi:hypothetical protein
LTFSPDAESALASLTPAAWQVAPDAAGARQLGRSYRGLLKEELIRAIEHAEAGLEAQVPLLRERIESLDPSKRFSPALFSGLSRIANAFRSESSDSVLDALQWLCSVSRKDLLDSRFRLGSILEEHWEEPFVAEIRKPPTDQHQEGDTRVQPLLETDLSIVDTVYSNALQLIEEADTDMHAEVIEHVTRCKLFQGGGIAALSSPRVFGAIYIRLPEDGVALGPYLIEHIIHETSHLALNALMAHDPLLENPQAIHSAPIRPDPRPLYQVLHGTFVLARNQRVLGRLARSRPQEFPLAEGFARSGEAYARGLDTLGEQAAWTPFGSDFFASFPDPETGRTSDPSST